MILHLSRMRRKVNRKVYNDRENVSATTFVIGITAFVFQLTLKYRFITRNYYA